MKRHLLCLPVLSAGLASGSVSADTLYFAAPYTGQRVTGYELQLPLDRHERRTYSIPVDCDKAVGDIQSGAGRTGSPIERRLWSKLLEDCRYHALLHPHDTVPAQDFVSNYDFYNGALIDLPLGLGCSIPGAPCMSIPPGIPRLSDLLRPDAGVQIEDDSGAHCEIRRGVFRGRIGVREGKIICEQGKYGSGFRIIAVHFADVNDDGIQDAVLRLVPLGMERGRTPLLLPLTRLSEDGPLRIPEGIPDWVSGLVY